MVEASPDDAARTVNPPIKALVVLLAFVVFVGLYLERALHLSTAQWWQACLLITSSLWFLLAGGLQSLHKDKKEQPPSTLLCFAVITEALKWFLLLFLPPTGKPLDNVASGWLSIVAVLAGVVVAFATFTLSALVSLSLDHHMVGLFKNNSFIRKVLGHLQRVVEWLQAHRVAAVSCALASFVLVSHFFALAVAFDDHAKSGPALYPAAPEYKSDAAGKVNANEESSWTILGDTVLTLHPTATKRSHDYHGSSTVKFFFIPGKADIQPALQAWPDFKRVCDQAPNRVLNDDDVATYVEGLLPSVSTHEGDVRKKRAALACNLKALCTSRQWFTQIAADGGEQAVLIFGHANADQIDAPHGSGKGPDYRSNTELASVRSHQVFVALNRMADEVEGETTKDVCARTLWEMAAGSSEGALIDPQSHFGRVYEPDLDPLVSVEVKRELATVQDEPLVDLRWALTRDPAHVHKLDLLDYLYFMTYTISTTGYGDLMPIKPTTKFVTAVANLVEVVYVAMIFGLIVMRRQPDHARKRERGGRGNNQSNDDGANDATHDAEPDSP